MPLFVHLAPESRLAQIRRNGINRLRRASGDRPAGVFAVPVTRNFYVSHQCKPPFCTCKYCTRGEYGARRMRERLGAPDD